MAALAAESAWLAMGWVGVEVAGAVWPRDPRSTKTRVGSVSDPPRSTGALLGDFDLVLAAFRRSPDPRGAAVTPHPHVEGAADWSSTVVGQINN